MEEEVVQNVGINEMLDSLTGVIESSKEEKVEESKVDEILEEEVVEVVESVEAEVPVVPEVEVEAVVEIDERDKTIDELRRKLNDAETRKVEVVEPKPLPPVTIEDQDFIGDLDVDDITRSKEGLNKLLNSVYMKGVNTSRDVTTEGVLRSLPEIVKANISIMSELKQKSDKFYVDNKDLVPFKKVVGVVFEELSAENPGKKIDEILPLVETETRKRLELYKKATTKTDKAPPILPNKRSSIRESRQKPDVSSMESAIDEMNKSLRG